MNWTDFLLQQGARPDCLDFGQPEAELAAARTATVLVPLVDQGVIELEGEDATGFAHNLLTNEINKLQKDSACHAGLCTPKGRLLATLLVWRREPYLRLALSADLLAGLQKKLSMYVLRSKVRIKDASTQTLLLGLSGPESANLLSSLHIAPLDSLKLGQFADGTAIRLGGDRYLIAVDAGAAEKLWLQLAASARPAGLAAWHWLEILAGVPRITAATQEAFVPQMVNYDTVGGVSFSKGCYPGQEIVARSHYLGKVKRHMRRARIEGDAAGAVAGARLFSGQAEDTDAGMVVLAAPSPLGGTEVLAVVQSDCFATGNVHLGSAQGPVLRFLPLPYDPDPAVPESPAGSA